MVIEGTPGVGSSINKGDGNPVHYTDEQVEVLEKVFAECQKPSHSQRQEVIRENPILFNLDTKQIKAWFQNRRCAEKQRKEAIEFQLVNEKLAATNTLLLLENERLQRELLELDRDNAYIRQLLQNNVIPALLLQFVKNRSSCAYAASSEAGSFPLLGLNCPHFSDVSMPIGYITDEDEVDLGESLEKEEINK